MTEDERLAGELAYLNKRADALDRELEKLNWDAEVLQGAIDQEDDAKTLGALVRHRGTVFDRMAAAHGEFEEVNARIAAIEREQDQGKGKEPQRDGAAAERAQQAAIARMSAEAFPQPAPEPSPEPTPGSSSNVMSWLDEPAQSAEPSPEPERKGPADDPLDWMRNPNEPEREPEPEMDPERGGGR